MGINGEAPKPEIQEWGPNTMLDAFGLQELFQLYVSASFSKLLLEVFSFVFW